MSATHSLARLGLTYRIGIHGVRSPHRKTEVRCTNARQHASLTLRAGGRQMRGAGGRSANRSVHFTMDLTGSGANGSGSVRSSISGISTRGEGDPPAIRLCRPRPASASPSRARLAGCCEQLTELTDPDPARVSQQARSLNVKAGAGLTGVDWSEPRCSGGKKDLVCPASNRPCGAVYGRSYDHLVHSTTPHPASHLRCTLAVKSVVASKCNTVLRRIRF